MNFWENVDEELKYKGMTRKALAQEAGFSLVNIGKGIKLGSSPSADTAVRIAKVLGVTVEYLVNGSSLEKSDSKDSQLNEDLSLFMKYRPLVKEINKLSPQAQKAVENLMESLKGM